MDSKSESIYAYLDGQCKKSFKCLILYNLIFFTLFACCRYVSQTDYSTFDMAGLERQIDQL